MVTLEDIVNERNLLIACGQVMSNDGAPGIDGMKAEELFSYLVQHWKELQTSVLEGKYRPEAVKRVEIPKPNGGVRQCSCPDHIGIADREDRTIQS